ncbi:hypothetical protein [Sphingomonas oligophenolica]|uniref:Uncharacterized protein n=1 Tax=Sphingomonas oligophenolica TaxID=301154 RepID=A0A502CKM7_9SPHN|nr:hypothetical protein [Sphingomonas oligophenolica]TPG13174.1 hypothetical protein EAH84_07175 [Sphingomonas oligophenolica]
MAVQHLVDQTAMPWWTVVSSVAAALQVIAAVWTIRLTRKMAAEASDRQDAEREANELRMAQAERARFNKPIDDALEFCRAAIKTVEVQAMANNAAFHNADPSTVTELTEHPFSALVAERLPVLESRIDDPRFSMAVSEALAAFKPIAPQAAHPAVFLPIFGKKLTEMRNAVERLEACRQGDTPRAEHPMWAPLQVGDAVLASMGVVRPSVLAAIRQDDSPARSDEQREPNIRQ